MTIDFSSSTDLIDDAKAYLIDVPAATDSRVQGWLENAALWLETRHNFRHMEASVEYVTTPGQRALNQSPESDWKEARGEPWLHTDSGGSVLLDWMASEHQARQLYSEDDPDEDGTPRFVLEVQTGLFEVFPLPDSDSNWNDGNYRVNIPYWSFTEDSDNILDNNEFYWMVLFRGVSEGMIFNREEERAELFRQKSEELFRQFVGRDKRSRIPPRPTVAPQLGVYGARTGRPRKKGLR